MNPKNWKPRLGERRKKDVPGLWPDQTPRVEGERRKGKQDVRSVLSDREEENRGSAERKGMNTPNYGNLEAVTEAWSPDEGIELEQHTWSRVHASIVNMRSNLARLMAENERLLAALKPFAQYAKVTLEIETNGATNPDEKLAFSRLTYGDFRRAVAVLKGEPK